MKTNDNYYRKYTKYLVVVLAVFIAAAFVIPSEIWSPYKDVKNINELQDKLGARSLKAIVYTCKNGNVYCTLPYPLIGGMLMSGPSVCMFDSDGNSIGFISELGEGVYPSEFSPSCVNENNKYGALSDYILKSRQD